MKRFEPFLIGGLLLLMVWGGLNLAFRLGQLEAPTLAAASVGCDESLWTHVYKPTRLLVHERCLAVHGTIVDATHGKRKDGLRHERDGDTHGWLRLDADAATLLNAGNRSHEGGNLVFEVVCAFPATQADAKGACRGYTSPIVIPPVGSHVEIVGAWVQDDNHAHWNELHPVTRIVVLQ